MSKRWATPVREYASRSLVSVAPETALQEVQTLLEQRDISSVPVVSAKGELQGIVSTTDLLRTASIEMATCGALAKVTPSAHLARDIMRRDVVTVSVDEDLQSAARLMITHRVHRLVVTRGVTPVGVLSTRDAMRAVLFHHIELPLSAVMSSPVESIEHGESIRSAIARLDEANVHGLVVTDGTWPVGVFTHTEAIRARALPAAFLETPVEQVMSYETASMDGETPLYRVAGQAIQTRLRRILVLEGRELRGIASGFDLVRVMTMDAA